MIATTERVYRTLRTRKGAENLVARDQEWLANACDWEQGPDSTWHNMTYVRVSTTTLEVRKADDGTFQVIQVTVPA